MVCLALEAGSNECRWFRRMSAVLSAVADGEVIERGGHDFDAFIKMAAAEDAGDD